MRPTARRSSAMLAAVLVAGLLLQPAVPPTRPALGAAPVTVTTATVTAVTHVAAPAHGGPRGLPLYRRDDTGAVAALTGAAAATTAQAARSLALLRRISSRPQAAWLGDSLAPARARTRAAALVAAGRRARAVPMLVLYAIPGRDCGGWSAGGAGGEAAYDRWVDAVAAGLGAGPAIVVLEPDALASMDCLPPAARRARSRMLARAVTRLAPATGVWTYLDVGHGGWLPAAIAAARLRDAGVARARGFSLNVANFRTTASEVAYGHAVSAALRLPTGRSTPFVVDTGRNGRGPLPAALADRSRAPAWCNPPGRALGAPPTTRAADPLVDALLWVKPPGNSDGRCRPGAPSAGAFWPAYALALAALASS